MCHTLARLKVDSVLGVVRAVLKAGTVVLAADLHVDRDRAHGVAVRGGRGGRASALVGGNVLAAAGGRVDGVAETHADDDEREGDALQGVGGKRR